MEKDTGRIEAFSDNIFGVAITLLGIQIAVNIRELGLHVTNQGLLQALIRLWPQYFAYFNSFASVLLMWIMHHRIFKMLRSTNVDLQLANGFLLLVIALVPFPTKTVGDFIGTPSVVTAVVFYSGYFVLVGAGFNMLCLVIRSNDHLRVQKIEKSTIDQLIKTQLLGMALNIAITICAFFYPKVALVCTFVMWVFWATLARRIEQDFNRQ